MQIMAAFRENNYDQTVKVLNFFHLSQKSQNLFR